MNLCAALEALDSTGEDNIATIRRLARHRAVSGTGAQGLLVRKIAANGRWIGDGISTETLAALVDYAGARLAASAPETTHRRIMQAA